ncbi:unnamed protein product [Lupinus luteus]|uniref:Terpene synthase metal-binding domain-containing protein n=1 Tax=Lupinus luteus TaxID=3873 RepID=A0AAV1XNZ1_LUPLU
MTEARWLNCKYIPTTEEYINISLVSSGYPLLMTTSYIGMGEIATEKIFKWVTNESKFVKASTTFARLMDDIVSNERIITNAWKDINEECLRPTKVAKPFVMRILNLARFADVIYKGQDNFTHADGVTKTYIQALFVDPVPT